MGAVDLLWAVVIPRDSVGGFVLCVANHSSKADVGFSRKPHSKGSSCMALWSKDQEQPLSPSCKLQTCPLCQVFPEPGAGWKHTRLHCQEL